MVTSDSSHTQHCSTAAPQHCRQLIRCLGCSHYLMKGWALESCHVTCPLWLWMYIIPLYGLVYWSNMKTRWRDVASTPAGPHTPHHTLGKLVTKASWWQPSSSVSMYPSPPALLCIHVSRPGCVSCGGAIISQCSRLQRTPTLATLAHGGQHETHQQLH